MQYRRPTALTVRVPVTGELLLAEIAGVIGFGNGFGGATRSGRIAEIPEQPGAADTPVIAVVLEIDGIAQLTLVRVAGQRHGFRSVYTHRVAYAENAIVDHHLQGYTVTPGHGRKKAAASPIREIVT